MRWFVVFLIAAMLAPAASAQPTVKSKGTQAVVAAVASSEDAIRAFAQAYNRRDWAAAYALFTEPAKRGFAESVRQGNVDDLAPGLSKSALEPLPEDDRALFVATMVAADGAGALPFQLTDIKIAGQTVNDPKFAIHLTRAAGTVMVFRTKLTAEGWRVENLSGSGGLAPDRLPWGSYR